jgi:pantoate--beta-alanine ligase
VNVATTIDEVRRWRRARGGSVGLVPTMGALHAGHLSLVERARAETAQVVASVFVNPAQFAPHEDFGRYPRDLERDRRLLEDSGCDLVFAPAVAEVYPAGFETSVDVGSVARPLEGERRPGHFQGVATVVLKLLQIVQPDRAYFGEKDAQQLAVIRRLARDLDLPVEIVGCPIVREGDGLAMSSRNAYLAPDERRAATVLSRALRAAHRRWQEGERDADVLRSALRTVLESEPRARVDYASVADPDTFRELQRIDGPALLLLAVFVGRARLIDNLRLG